MKTFAGTVEGDQSVTPDPLRFSAVRKISRDSLLDRAVCTMSGMTIGTFAIVRQSSASAAASVMSGEESVTIKLKGRIKRRESALR